MTRTALFFNFTNKEFIGYWDGKPHKFAAGQKKYLPEWLARHFAKHLTNQVLIETGKENYTSPKKPEQVPQFMEVFNKAFFLEPDQEDQSDLDNEIDIANRNQPSSFLPPSPKPKTQVDNKEPQTVLPPEGDEDDEENFEGMK